MFVILRIFVVKGGAPLLLSNRVLRSLKLVSDFDKDEFFCKLLDTESVFI